MTETQSLDSSGLIQAVASTSGLDPTSLDAQTIYTVPDGKTLLLFFAAIIPSATNISNAGMFNIGGNATTYDDFKNGVMPNFPDSSNKVAFFSTGNAFTNGTWYLSYAAGTAIKMKVSAGNGSGYTVTIKLFGILI